MHATLVIDSQRARIQCRANKRVALLLKDDDFMSDPSVAQRFTRPGAEDDSDFDLLAGFETSAVAYESDYNKLLIATATALLHYFPYTGGFALDYAQDIVLDALGAMRQPHALDDYLDQEEPNWRHETYNTTSRTFQYCYLASMRPGLADSDTPVPRHTKRATLAAGALTTQSSTSAHSRLWMSQEFEEDGSEQQPQQQQHSKNGAFTNHRTYATPRR